MDNETKTNPHVDEAIRRQKSNEAMYDAFLLKERAARGCTCDKNVQCHCGSWILFPPSKKIIPIKSYR